MDLMLLGETVRLNPTEEFVGYWMPSRGSKGIAAAEVFYCTAVNTFEVAMDTKSSDEADSSATPIGAAAVTGTGQAVYEFDITNAKDLVRYRLSHVDDAGSGQTLHLQFSQPLWSPN